MEPKVDIGLGPGFRLGPYSIIHAISSGWEAQVYAACDSEVNGPGNLRAIKFHLLFGDEVGSAPVWTSSELATKPRGRLFKKASPHGPGWYQRSERKKEWRAWVRGVEAKREFIKGRHCGRGAALPELYEHGLALLPYRGVMAPFGFEVMSYHQAPSLAQFLAAENDPSALTRTAHRLGLGLHDLIINFHQAGFLVFNDIHAGNILVEAERLIMVDLEPPKKATPELLAHQVECALVLAHQALLWDLVGLHVQAHFAGTVISDWVEDVWFLDRIAAESGRGFEPAFREQLVHMVRATHPDAWPRGLWR